MGTADREKGISTVSILAQAESEGIELLTITKENVEEQLKKLNTDDETKQAVREAAESGMIVTIPERDVTMGDWTGMGYIIMNPENIGGRCMYGINIFDKIKMPLDWAIVYYGIKNNILDIDIAQEFSCRKIENGENLSEEELELCMNLNDRMDVLELIERVLYNQGYVEESLKKAKDKIRIAIIIYLRETVNDKAKLLEEIDMIYADFDYPTDMECFVSYMPACDKNFAISHTIEDNRNNLLSKLDNFIETQKNKYQLEGN